MVLSVALGRRIAALGRTHLSRDLNNRKVSTTFKTSDSKIIDIDVSVPNSLCEWRVETLYTKERSLINWVETCGGTGSFFDIGANVGLFSLFFAKRHTGNIYAFEPSPQNLIELQKNVSLNNLDERIHIIPNALSDSSRFNSLMVSSQDAGAAFVSFGDPENVQLQGASAYTNTSVLGFSLDDMFNLGLLEELPSMIKIDVDGVEDRIIFGAQEVLRSSTCRMVCIEVVEGVTNGAAEIARLLSEAGFHNRSDIFAGANEDMNQYWSKE